MFAVMGISGNVGGAIANTLLQHGQKVRGVVRDDTKAIYSATVTLMVLGMRGYVRITE